MLNLIHFALIMFQIGTVQKADTITTTRHKHVKLIHYADIKRYPPPPLPFGPPVPRKHPLPAIYINCAFTDRYTPKQRLHKYPYSKAAKIVAVSYPPPGDNLSPDTIGLHVTNGILNPLSIKESIELNAQQIRRLTFLIFNTANIPAPPSFHELEMADPGSKCMFSPRHALLFYDKNGKIFDYFEICFQCMQYGSESGRIKIGELCGNKYDLLKAYFKSIGLTYHLTKNDSHD